MAGYNDQALYDAVQSGKLKLSDLTTQGQNNYNAYAATKQLTKAQPSVLTAPVEQQPSDIPQKKAKKQVDATPVNPSTAMYNYPSTPPSAVDATNQGLLKMYQDYQNALANSTIYSGTAPKQANVGNIPQVSQSDIQDRLNQYDINQAIQQAQDIASNPNIKAPASLGNFLDRLSAGSAYSGAPGNFGGTVKGQYIANLPRDVAYELEKNRTDLGSPTANFLTDLAGQGLGFFAPTGAAEARSAAELMNLASKYTGNIPYLNNAIGKVGRALVGGGENVASKVVSKLPQAIQPAALNAMKEAARQVPGGLYLGAVDEPYKRNINPIDNPKEYAQSVGQNIALASGLGALGSTLGSAGKGIAKLINSRKPTKLAELVSLGRESQPALPPYNTPLGLPAGKPALPAANVPLALPEGTLPKVSKKYSIKNAQDARQKMYEGMFDSLDYPDRQKVLENVFGGDLTNIVRRTSPEVEALAGQTSEQQRTQKVLEEAFKNLPAFQQNAAIREVLNQKPSISYRGAKLPNTPVRPVEQPKPAVEGNPSLTQQVASDLGAKTEPVAATEAKKKGGIKPKNVATQIENNLKGTTQQIGEDIGKKPEEQVVQKSEPPVEKVKPIDQVSQQHKKIDDEINRVQNHIDELKQAKGELPSASKTQEAKSTVVEKPKPKPKQPTAETKSADEQVRESRTGSQQQQQTSAQTEKPVTREEVMNTLRKKLDVTIRTKRLGRVKKTVLGINKTKSEVSRTRTHGDISTIAHEVGHTLDTRYGLTSKANQKELIDFVNKHNPPHLSNYPDTADHVPEAVAEYFRAYLTDKATAESMAPEFTALLEKTLSKKDFAGLNKSAEVAGKWHNQTNAVDRVKEHILSGKAPKQKSWKSWVEKRYQETVDKFLPLAKAGIQALNPKLRGKSNLDAFMSHAKGLHPESMAAYEQARRYAGTPAITRLFLDENLEPVMKELSKHKLLLDDLIAYATAKHASDLHDIAKSKGILDSPDGFNPLTGMKNADVQGTISALGTPEMQRVHKMLLNYNRNLLDIAYEGGLISEKTRDTLVNRYPNYVPFQRFFSESEGEANFTGKGTQKAFADIYSPIKSFKGSTRTIKDPLESMVANAHSIIDAVERNKVGQEVAKLYSNQGAGFLVERLGVKDRQGIAKGVPKENIITVMENGKRVLYQVNPDLYQVLQNINPKSAEFVEKYASKVANVMRGAISITPKFVIKQLLVDDWNTLMVSDKRFFIPYVDTIRGMVHLFKSPDVVRRWIKSGGAYGAMFSQDPRYIQAAINEIRTDQSMLPTIVKYVRMTPKVLRHLLEAPNEARNLITFKQLTEGKSYGGKKYTDEQAAYIARDLMDFQRRGSKMDAISRSTPFFNANIQAKDRSVRALRQNWKQFMAKGAVSMALPSVAIYYYNRYYASDKQKQAIEEAPTWFKNTNYLVAVPGTDLVARFPKPYDVSWAFANGTEEVIRRIEKDNPKAISDFAEENLINDAFPQLFSPALIAIGAMANYDFHTGAPIVSKYLENPNKSEEYDAYTSKFARVLGDTFNLSPKKIDYVVKGYLGDYATIGNKALNSTFLKNVYKDDASVPDDGFWQNYLGVNNFVYPEGKYQAQSVTDFYDNYQKIAGDYDVAKRRGKNYGMSNLYGTVNQAYKYINSDQRMIKAIQSDKEMSVDDKKVAIDNLKQDMLKIARSTNSTIKSVGGGQ
jgi:hypothetical protein